MGTFAGGALAKTLATQLEFTFNVFQANTAGVDHAMSLRSPRPAGNSMNWIGGHLVGARCGLLKAIGGEPVWDEKKIEPYKRGSAPISEESAIPWDEITAALAEAHDRLRAALAAVSEEALLAAVPEEKNTFKLDNIAEVVGVYAFHEAYHVGQLGVVRRTIGLEGAIS